MLFEINKLIESECYMIKKVGWLIYNREDQNGGLNKEELNELLSFLNETSLEEVFEKGREYERSMWM